MFRVSQFGRYTVWSAIPRGPYRVDAVRNRDQERPYVRAKSREANNISKQFLYVHSKYNHCAQRQVSQQTEIQT